MKTDRRTFLKAGAALLAGAAAEGVYRESSADGSLKENADAMLRNAATMAMFPA